MLIYPYTPSQVSNLSAEQWIAFLQSPTMVGRRLSEILTAQQFIGLYLLTGRWDINGGAIAVPVNEKIRTERRAEGVAPGGEYKLTPLSAEQYELYLAAKRGIATEVTDEQVKRALRQPVDDAFTFLQTELVFDANDQALGVIHSSISQTLTASAPWTNGKAILRDALRARQKARALRLGFDIDTAVLPGELYAEVMPELIDILPKDSTQALGQEFPTIGGIQWVAADGDEFEDPTFVDRRRLGGIARENIPSPEYRPVPGDTGVEVMVERDGKREKTHVQARNAGVPIVAQPLAGLVLTGAVA